MVLKPSIFATIMDFYGTNLPVMKETIGADGGAKDSGGQSRSMMMMIVDDGIFYYFIYFKYRYCVINKLFFTEDDGKSVSFN